MLAAQQGRAVYSAYAASADGLRGEQESAFGGQENWSGAPLLSRASMNLKKTKAAVLTDDEVDDADWTCQGCLVRCLYLLCYPTLLILFKSLKQVIAVQGNYTAHVIHTLLVSCTLHVLPCDMLNVVLPAANLNLSPLRWLSNKLPKKYHWVSW